MSGIYKTLESKVETLEREFRENTKTSLDNLAKEFVLIRREFHEMKQENASQHGDLTLRVEVIYGSLKSEIEKISKRLEEKVTGNSIYIRGLLVIVLVISGVLGEAKLHISTLFKYLGLDK